MRLPPGVSIRKDACPSQVSVPAIYPLLLDVTWREPNERGTSDEEANLRNVTRCAIPASLLVASLLGGSAGFTLLLLGLAVLAVVALAFYGDFVDGSADDS